MFFRICLPEFYLKLKENKFTIDELVSELANLFPPSILSPGKYSYISTDTLILLNCLGQLIIEYNTDELRNEKMELLINQEKETHVNFNLSGFDEEGMVRSLRTYYNHSDYQIGIAKVISRVEFASDFS